MSISFKQFVSISSNPELVEESLFDLLDEGVVDSFMNTVSSIAKMFGGGKEPSSADKARARAEAWKAYQEIKKRVDAGEKLPAEVMDKFKDLEQAMIKLGKVKKSFQQTAPSASASEFRRGSAAAGRAVERDWVAQLSS